MLQVLGHHLCDGTGVKNRNLCVYCSHIKLALAVSALKFEPFSPICCYLDKPSMVSIPDFKGDLVTPIDPGYDDAIKRWAVNAQRRAAVVAFVRDADDVALALKYARDQVPRLPIAIRGGGHHAAGASSVEGGLVIDLSKYMNGVRISREQKLAYIGGGAIWETVDKEAMKEGLAAVAGSVNHVRHLLLIVQPHHI